MIARLNGIPLARTEGDRKISLTKELKSVNVFVNEAMRKQPMIIVVKHVKPKRATFTHGNFCGRVCSNSISAD